MEQLEYLESERVKIWEKLLSLEEYLQKRTPDYEADARNSSKKASEYKNRSEKSLENITTTTNEILQYKEKISKTHTDIDRMLAEITSRNESVARSCQEVEDHAQKIESILESINNSTSNLSNILTDIEKKKQQISLLDTIISHISEQNNKIELHHKNILEKSGEINEIYLGIFGYIETDAKTGKESAVDGLKDKLESSYKELTKKIDDANRIIENIVVTSTVRSETVEKKWEAHHGLLKEKIEALLPNALTAGLSHAYSQKKDEEIKERKKISWTFTYAIWGLIFISLIPFAVSGWTISNGLPLEDALARLPRLVLSIIPLYIPVLWVAYSANKKLNLSKRLIEEYTHKEVLSKTYEGLSRQISEIEDSTSKELQIKLLYNILEISSENPGKLISDYNKSDHPLMDALDKSVQLTNAVNKLSRIPGFSKIAASMNEKSEKLLNKENEKASQGIDMVK